MRRKHGIVFVDTVYFMPLARVKRIHAKRMALLAGSQAGGTCTSPRIRTRALRLITAFFTVH